MLCLSRLRVHNRISTHLHERGDNLSSRNSLGKDLRRANQPALQARGRRIPAILHVCPG
jgi:hypothetical protein